jgi:hypothetical protein
MKGTLLIGAAAASAGILYLGAPRGDQAGEVQGANGGNFFDSVLAMAPGSPAASPTVGQATSLPADLLSAEEPEPHEFNLTLWQIVPKGAAIAFGGFHPLAVKTNHYFSPLNDLPGQTKQVNSRGYESTEGDIWINGLPGGEVDHQKWNGWLVRDGTKTYTTERGVYRTLRAYRVVPAPVLPAPKAGAWMWKR